MSDALTRLTAALSDRVGGLPTVYLAEDLKHLRKVPIKLLRPELSASRLARVKPL